ncbi:MAG: phosphatase PAP2 family protein [Ruminiclostridium sp.]
MYEKILEFDFSVLDFIQDNFADSYMDAVMKVISSSYLFALWIILGIVLIFIKKQRLNGISILCSLGITILLTEFLIKLIIMRERPYQLNEAHVLLIAPPIGTSFPSSHTALSFAVAVVLLRVSKPIGISAIVFALLVGFSRMYLYVHFPTDVLAGAVVGTAIAIISTLAVGKIAKKISEKKQAANT